MDYDEKYEEWPSDVVMFKQARQYYLGDKFMAYFATVTPHQTYHVPSEFGDKYKDNWKDTKYSTRLKRYLSKLKTLDLALEELLRQLEEEGKLQDTVIALFGDHYPYGLQDSDINMYLEANNAGYTVSRNSTKNKNVDRTPMVIYNSEIEPMQVTEYTTIIDLLPTLLNMFDMEYDPRLYLGTDIMSDSHKSLAVFADGSWQNEYGFYYAPTSKMTYSQSEFKYTNEELKTINTDIKTRQKMSTSAIKNNYFNYLISGINKYKEIKTTTTTTVVPSQNEGVTTTTKNESEE
jgi:phosphoglycerol transferase MdoB-like AlkP superfamily enzyme